LNPAGGLLVDRRVLLLYHAMLAGVGFGMVIISAIVCVYYNVIIAWTVYYFVLSFSWELPWATCGHYWNTDKCYTRSGNTSRGPAYNGVAAADGLAKLSTIANFSVTGGNFTGANSTSNFTLNDTKSPSEEFFE